MPFSQARYAPIRVEDDSPKEQEGSWEPEPVLATRSRRWSFNSLVIGIVCIVSVILNAVLTIHLIRDNKPPSSKHEMLSSYSKLLSFAHYSHFVLTLRSWRRLDQSLEATHLVRIRKSC